MPRSSVSLVCMRMGLADQTEFSRGVIWSTHIAIDVDLFQVTCILFASESLEYRADILLRNYGRVTKAA